MLHAAAIATDLAERGWSCRDGFVQSECIAVLRAEAQSIWMRGEYRSAAVGGGARRALRPAIRGDEIHWLTTPLLPALERLSAALEQLRLGLNRELALGLFDLEWHFARYAPGNGYARHLDQLAGSDARVLSWVLYLNEEWREEEGGALRLYTTANPDASFLEFAPRAGRLMSFLSERFEHEVLPATRERLSVTGWYRRRSGP